ncbi:tRNA preQ1(34) S-adenosylmethionine ribosyltransferase-isomerase QueA [Rubrivirga marina]|uniref:S-adenosylmethionine:tRNA ribosyltransferase-isomerase n=1 Tax=Rubrivirga marina TaxID=1196024 RepID=A0A271J0H0_9BACT|nr:tRNA preQ1(34) S-adenosylmethionine ribosyltransferase-isomerase QueA [Rubrivirga marina]PAP76738.1 tRNA preQ1(34) S-adenosylmethionine ribosyltransferase-isomerase QueA [Rubrivirga marina]
MQVAHPSFRQHSLRLSDFDYEYPRELIAAYPAEPRDTARLMVVDRAEGTIEHRTVRDLPEYFNEGDVLVANDTMVFPARLRGIKENTGAKVEAFLLRELNPEHRLWDSIVDPARKVRVGNKLVFGDGLAAEVIDNTTSRGRTLRFMFDGTPDELYARIDAIGETPIPPYLRRPAEPADRVRYQTIFARKRGAVAAPSAGLHFTPGLLQSLTDQGCEVAYVTLHTGLGSFNPVEVEDLSKHRMDSEFFEVLPEAAETVNAALTHPERTVTACGTTVVRAVESSLSASKTLKAGRGWTDKFIYPVYSFHIPERLLTNFHRPKSTLLMTVAAFAGYDLLMEAYEEAVREEYRMFAFGDAMLVL